MNGFKQRTKNPLFVLSVPMFCAYYQTLLSMFWEREMVYGIQMKTLSLNRFNPSKAIMPQDAVGDGE